MQTWGNYIPNRNLFTPYHNAPNGLEDFELLPAFIDFSIKYNLMFLLSS